MYSYFRIVNTDSHGKQFYQLEDKVYVQFWSMELMCGVLQPHFQGYVDQYLSSLPPSVRLFSYICNTYIFIYI